MSTAQTNNAKATAMAPADLGKKVNYNAPAASVNDLGKMIEKMKSQFALALPKHLTAERLQRLAMTQYSSNTKLQQCTMASIAAAMITASQLGLEVGINGQAYIIPFGNKATFIPGWKGMVDLVNRAGRSTVWTGAVYEGDKFEWCLGDSPFLKHKPAGEDKPDKLLYAYSVGRVNGSDWPIIECWTNARIERHLRRHKKVADKDHYALKDDRAYWEMYARKVVLLQVCKYLPSSIEMMTAMDLSNREEEGRSLILDGAMVPIELDSDGNTIDGTANEVETSQTEPTEGAQG